LKEKCNEAWIKVKNSTLIKEIQAFISSYPESKSIKEAKKLIEDLKSKTPFDLFIESCKNSNMSLETSILKKIKEGNIDSNIKKML